MAMSFLKLIHDITSQFIFFIQLLIFFTYYLIEYKQGHKIHNENKDSGCGAQDSK